MKILEVVVDLEEARIRERYWIQSYANKGVPLVNTHYAGRIAQLKNIFPNKGNIEIVENLHTTGMELGKAEEVAEHLRQKITDGTLQSGTKIGSERDLSGEFGVSRMTIRHAIEILESEGLVARYPGRGTFVGNIRERVVMEKGREKQTRGEAPSITASELRMSGSFLKDMERLGRKPRVQFLEQPALVPSDSEIARHLNIEKGTLVFKRYRLQLADNLPYRLIESYYPIDLFGELLTTDIGDKPLFVWLQERHNLRVSRAQEILIARLATPRERQFLRIASNAPVVALDRTVWTETNRPVEWAHIVAVVALYTFTYEYDILEWNRDQKQEGNQENSQ